MVPKIVTVMLIVVGIIHLLPLAGVLGGERLNTLYGVALGEPNLELLMRHRAVLFGLLGGFFVFAAFQPGYQVAAFVMAAVSIASFFALAAITPEVNAEVRRVVIADVVAAVALILAVVARELG